MRRVIQAARLEDTAQLAGRLAAEVRRAWLAAAGASSALIGLSGDLGAGKTAFVQAFVAALAPDEDHEVTSSTFAIVQVYETEPPVTHLDLYRLSSLAELEAIDYRMLYFGPGVTLVEWMDRVPDAIPPDWLEIRMTVRREDAREIELIGHGRAMASLVAAALP